MFIAVPAACPVFICPAETEGQIQLGMGQKLVQGPLQQALPAEPVIVEAKAVDTIFSGEFNLPPLYLGNTQIVETQLTGQARLVMAHKVRFGFGYIGPFSKTSAPPSIIFRNWMKLRQVECNGFHCSMHGIKVCLSERDILLF